MAAIVTKDGVIESPKTNWIRICNISMNSKNDQIQKLFSFFGEIAEIRIYPTDEFMPVSSKVSYIKYSDFCSCNGAVHLTGTVFVDRPLIVIPIYDGEIPDEDTAISNSKILASSDMSQYIIGGMIMQGFSQLNLNFGFPHVPEKPTLDSDMPSYKIDETRRTIFIHNIHNHASAEMILAIFSGVGEVKYIRLCDSPDKNFKYALVEYTDIHSILAALQYHGFPIYGRPIQIGYSATYIMKAEDWKRKGSKRRSRSTSPSSRVRRLSPPRYTHRGLLRRSRSPPNRRFSRRRSRSREKYQRFSPHKIIGRSRSRSRKASKNHKRSRSKDRKSVKKSKDKKDRSRSKDRSEKSSKRKSKDSKKEKSKKNLSNKSSPRRNGKSSKVSSADL